MPKRSSTGTTAPDLTNTPLWRNRITDLVYLSDANEIAVHQMNWRTHDEAQRAALRGLLQQVGIVGAALGYYSDTDGGHLKLIDGHLRREEIQQGLPVLLTDLNDDEAALVLATLDPIGAMAGMDALKLAVLLEQAQTSDDALASLLRDLQADSQTVAHRAANNSVPAAKPQRTPINWEQFKLFHVWCEMRARWPRFNYLVSYAYKAKVNWKTKHDGLVMVDSGLITGCKTAGKRYLNYQPNVVQFAEDIQADRVVMMDVPLIPEVLEPLGISAATGKRITLENAQAFAELKTGLQKVYVIQGPQIADFAAFSDSIQSLIKPNDVVAIGGGLKNRSGDQVFVLGVLHEVRARFPHNDIHLLGVGSPQVLGVASQFGASSADCATAEMNSNFASLMQFAPTDPALINRLNVNESWPVPLQLDKTQLYPKLTATNMFNLELAIMLAIQQNFSAGGTDV